MSSRSSNANRTRAPVSFSRFVTSVSGPMNFSRFFAINSREALSVSKYDELIGYAFHRSLSTEWARRKAFLCDAGRFAGRPAETAGQLLHHIGGRADLRRPGVFNHARNPRSDNLRTGNAVDLRLVRFRNQRWKIFLREKCRSVSVSALKVWGGSSAAW